MASDPRDAYSPFASVTEPRAAGAGAAGPRADGRSTEQFRELSVVKVGTVQQATGSSYIELGQGKGSTKVLCGVYGPREGSRAAFSEEGRLRVDVKFATFATPIRGVFGQGPEQKQLSSQVAQALHAAVLFERFPKAEVDVFVLVLEAHGSELAASVLAATAALVHAGVPMRDLVTCCSLASIGGCIYMDPTPWELTQAEATATVAMLPGSEEVTLLSMSGKWEGESSTEAFEFCVDGCAVLDQRLRVELRAQTAAAKVGATDAAA